MSNSGEATVVVLGGAILDLARGTLTRDGVIIPLRSKSFRLLCELARNSGRVMSKDELLSAVWPGVIVSEDSLTQAVRDIRRDAMKGLKELVDNGDVGADEEHRAEERVQKLTDEHTKHIDDLLKHKEQEVMEV